MGQLHAKNTDIRYSILRQCFLFEGIAEAIPAFCEGLELVEYTAGQPVFPPERQGRQMGIIADGKAEVCKEGSGVVMSILGAGDEFGAAGLYSGMDYFVTNITSVGSVSVLYIDRVRIDALLNSSPQAARNFIAYLSRRIYFLNGRIDGFTSGSVERSLALYIADGCTGGEMVLPCTLARLADVLHVGRASLYRAFDSLTQKGIIQRNNRYIRVLDMERLHLSGGIE